MDPIPYFFDSINRNAVVVHGKKPFFDWISFLYPESPVTGQVEGNIYLVREMDSNEQIEKWLKRNFDKIFQNELNDWHIDATAWPQKRTFKTFCDWFSYEIHSMVLDMEKSRITKD